MQILPTRALKHNCDRTKLSQQPNMESKTPTKLAGTTATTKEKSVKEFKRIPEHVDDDLDKEIMETPDIRTPVKEKPPSAEPK